MLVKVINKSESVIYGSKIYGYEQSFEVDEIIGKSLIERGYVEQAGGVVREEDAGAKGEQVADDVAETHTGYLDEAQIASMSYQDLKRLAAQMGLDTKGKKDDLIARICAEEVKVDDEAVAEDETTEGETAGDLPNTSMPD